MRAKELRRLAWGFRQGLLAQRSSDDMCFAVSAALQGYLGVMGQETDLTRGAIEGCEHYWLTLPDKSIIDATADQFQQPSGEPMPPVYIGEKPEWYKGAVTKAEPVPVTIDAVIAGRRKRPDMVLDDA